MQFVLFYVSGLSRALTDAFLDFLWKRARDAAQPEVIRRAAASYIASFAARAKFCNDATLRAVFANMLAWTERWRMRRGRLRRERREEWRKRRGREKA